MPALTFPFSSSNVPIGASFATGSDLACPTGSAYTADDALGVLERVTNNVLLDGFRDWRKPMFPLAGEPVRAATYQEMSINSKVQQHVFYPNLHRTPFYNPIPALATYEITKELIDECGGSVATAQFIANSNSLGCAPPRGDRALAGKDRYYQGAATGVLELGPFCITEFLDLRNFAATLEAYKKAAMEAGGMALEYEKIRQFVAMSRKNASAVAGTVIPKFTASTYSEFPTSAGSLEWVLRAIDVGIGGELMGSSYDNDAVIIECSAQLRKFWINQYSVQHGVEIRDSLGGTFTEVKGYIHSFEDNGDFTMISLRTNRKVVFRISKVPVYTEMKRTGPSAGQWDFQEFYVTELGNDTQSGQANGFRQTGNPFYGDPVNFCEGEERVLCEQILIHTKGAFHYEAFPNNPLRTRIAADVETNLQNLWGGTEVMWSFGTDVQQYWLDPMNAQLVDTGFSRMSNIDHTWFAGRVKFGLQFVEDRPLEMMSLMVRVPTDESPLSAIQTLADVAHPTAINITAAPTKPAPEFCTIIPDGVSPPTPGPGKAVTPFKLDYDLPASGNRTVTFTFHRVGGVTGALTVPFVVTNGTATEGSNASVNHFQLNDGNIVFADGEETATISIILHPIARADGDPAFVTATLDYDNSPVVIITGGVESTILQFTLYDAP